MKKILLNIITTGMICISPIGFSSTPAPNYTPEPLEVTVTTPIDPAERLDASGPIEPLNKIVAIVNKGFITSEQLNAYVSMIKSNLSDSGTPLPPDNILKEQVLQQMIIQTLQLQLADETGIRVSDDDVTKMIANIATQNHKTVEELYENFTKAGNDYALFRTEIRNELIIHQLQQRDVASHIFVTPQEVADYLRQRNAIANNQIEYHLENILISLPESPTPEEVTRAQDTANTLLSEIHAGKNFRQLAVEHSSGQQALKGGDLGWRKLAELPTVFANEIATMSPGDTAGPIRTPNGFHIIKLTDTRKDTTSPSTQEDQDREIQELIFQRKLNEHLQIWLTQMRANAFIDIKNETTTP